MNANTTLNTHININQISKATAHTDLKDLVKKGFLITKRQGKYIYYYATPKIKELFL
jgi:predicted transcriptional regulator